MAATMKAWQYSGTSGGLEKNLALNEIPRLTQMGDQEVLIKVISASLNPADYKVPEMGLVSRAVISRPATPASDFVGRVVALGKKIDSFQVGELVFGKQDYVQHGCLGEYIAVRAEGVVSLPNGVDLDQAAGIPTTGLTVIQPLVANVKPGDKVFLNGGAGGTGTAAIQIAKLLGAHVTVTCSGPKAALCKELGADEVIDYTTTDISQKLKEGGPVFKLVLDFVATPAELYKAADDYLLPDGKFIQVGGGMNMTDLTTTMSRALLPGFLGGGHRKYEFYVLKVVNKDLVQLGKWLAEGKLKTVIDTAYAFEDAPKAFDKLKTGRATGKIVVHVSEK